MRARAKMYNMAVLFFDICHRTAPLRMYFVTLTNDTKVRIANSHRAFPVDLPSLARNRRRVAFVIISIYILRIVKSVFIRSKLLNYYCII